MYDRNKKPKRPFSLGKLTNYLFEVKNVVNFSNSSRQYSVNNIDFILFLIYLGTIVVTIVAVDNDISPNNVISFSLLESAEDRFRVNSAGNIIVNIQSGGSRLDHEFSTSHTLIVESSDGTLTDTATIYIPVGDVNDNAPIFLETSYSIGVLETTVTGTTILAVQVCILF